MTPTPDDALQSPQESDSDSNVNVPRTRPAKSHLDSVSRIPYRRSNASLSNLFASTTSLPTQPHARSESESAAATPTASAINGSLFSPDGSTIRSPSPSASTQLNNAAGETRDLIVRALAPHVSVLASQDTEELIRHKGITGGLLELLRPFGERVSGKVTVRDSTGASRSWEDFCVRFAGVKDGLESPRLQDRRSMDSTSSRNGQRASVPEYKPARLRSGGDVLQVEELVERHLTFAEEQSGPVEADYINHKEVASRDPRAVSPFYQLYLRRLLSGLPMTPSETFSHPVASVIAISSRSTSPIEQLRTLYDSSNAGENRLPQWVHNEFLRYYVLIHDEDYDDIQKSVALYEQMKRHFGLHCHLLRLRSTQCVSSDDDAIKLPSCEWMSAAEELAEITRRESNEDDEDPTPCIFESDATAIRAFVREMITQSVVPFMERASATWNDQVASRRRGLSGRFMSLSKRFTAFGGNRNSSGPSLGGSSSNYDSLQGFYRPDAPEAIIRKLADYAVMLRDYKLAQSTYEILCSDFKSDKAWRYYAGANEMAAICSLIVMSGPAGKVRVEAVNQYLETAYYSYITRVRAPYNALRTLLLGVELLKMRGGSALDDAARWSSKILDDRLVGAVGHALLMERIAACYSERKGVAGLSGIERRRKAAFWSTLSTDAWLSLEKASRAERCLNESMRLYDVKNDKIILHHMRAYLDSLREAVDANRSGLHHLDGADLLVDVDEDQQTLVEPLQDENEQLALRPGGISGSALVAPLGGANIHTHRKTASSVSHTSSTVPPPPPIQTSSLDPLGASVYGTTPVSATNAGAQGARRPSLQIPHSIPLSPHAETMPSAGSQLSPREERRADGFE